MKKGRIEIAKLPKLVQQFISREVSEDIIKYPLIRLDILHEKANWTKATSEERLSYAAYKYVGKEVICLSDGEDFIVVNIDPVQHWDKEIWCIGGKGFETDCPILIYDEGEWAEIVTQEEPTLKEASKEHQEEFRKANPEMVVSKETFRVGDDTTDGEILHFNNGVAWVRKEGQSMGRLISVTQLRKPIDPDKDLKELADEIINSNGCIHIIGSEKHTIIETIKLKEMLLEMAKKTQKLNSTQKTDDHA